MMMPMYRLLSNNKETGPYSLQDLTELPLKAYDLVWIEGKSFSWKYPSEIEELKEFAPPAPEDFYVQYHSPADIPLQPELTVAKPASFQQIIKEEGIIAPAAIAPKPVFVQKKPGRYVSVILPASLPEKERVDRAPVRVTLSKETGNLTDETAIPKTEHIHAHAKKRALIATAFLALLAGGIYLGTSQLRIPTAEPGAIKVSMASFKNPAGDIQNAANSSGEEFPVIKPNRSLDFAAIQRFVQVKPGEYQVGLFGGISRLELLVTNRSEKPLSNVEVEVEYLDIDKAVSHKETVMVHSINPFETVKATVHDSPYGIAFRTKITGVNGLKGQ